MEWTNELIMQFLHLYRNEPILWNITAAQYKNKSDKNAAWMRIKHNLGNGNVPLLEIKKKRENLMSTYRRQRMKVRMSLKYSGPDAMFKPEWRFYNFMSEFLDDIYKPRKYNQSDDSLDIEDSEDEKTNSGIEDSKKDGNFAFLAVNKIETNKRKYKTDEFNQRNKYNSFKRHLEKPSSDTCSLYCDLLYVKLRSLTENTRDIAMMEIDRLIYNLKQQENSQMASASNVEQPDSFQMPITLSETHSLYEAKVKTEPDYDSNPHSSPERKKFNPSPRSDSS